jgi:hypothetical protein
VRYRSQLSHHAARNSADFTLRLSFGRFHDASTKHRLATDPPNPRLDLLLDLKRRGLDVSPRLVIADGALGLMPLRGSVVLRPIVHGCRTWLEENDPEGAAYEYEVPE